MLVLDHGCVEYDVVSEFGLCSPNVVCHAFEHFEAEAVFRCAILLCEEVGVGDGEEVVACHSDMEHLGVLGQESSFDEVEVVGIDLRLVGANGVRPSSQVAYDVLHIEVASFHDSHLNGASAFRHALTGELEQLALEEIGVGQVALDHDTSLIVLELGQREHMLEESHREVCVLVFLHVEVDELGTFHAVLIDVGIVDGGLIEFGHASHQLGETFLVVEGVGLGIDTRDLHGDIVDVGFLERLKV